MGLVSQRPWHRTEQHGGGLSNYLTNRARQMAINLVVYFNGFPIKLPAFNPPPHTPTQRGAIQSYVYQQVAEAARPASWDRS